MTTDQLIQSALNDDAPPADLTEELQALWHTKAGNWTPAHDIAQDIHTDIGSWIHGLLHLIEGDLGNANYWFSKAGRPRCNSQDIGNTHQIDKLWLQIATELLDA